MSLLTLWPSYTDDTGNSTSGTIINATLLNDAKAAIEDHTHSLNNPTVKPKTITDEVITARGNLASLNARLAGVIDANGALIAPASIVSATQLGQNEGLFNIARNSDFRLWTAGTTSAPDEWVLAGTGAAILRTGVGQADTSRKVGEFAARVTYGSATATLTQTVIATGDFTNYNYLIGEEVTVGAWVRTAIASHARIRVDDGNTVTSSSYHTGGNAYEFLTVNPTISGSATKLDVYLSVEAAGAAYISGLTVFIGTIVMTHWKPNPLEPIYDQTPSNHGIKNMQEGFEVYWPNGGAIREWGASQSAILDLPEPTDSLISVSNTNAGTITAANTVYVVRIFIPFRILVTTIGGEVFGTNAGTFFGVGIYNSGGTSRLIDSGPKSTGAAGFISTALATPLPIGPGWYLYACCCDSIVPTFAIRTLAAGNARVIASRGYVQYGTAANASVAGQLPATLGALTVLAASTNIIAALAYT